MSKKASAIVFAIAASTRRQFRVPPDPEDMNDARAGAAEDALNSFTKNFGEVGDDLEVQNLTDLIADFAHYCDRQDISFSDILRMAQKHYAEETDNKGQQDFFC